MTLEQSHFIMTLEKRNFSDLISGGYVRLGKLLEGGGEECNILTKDPGLESAMHNFVPK